MADVRPGPAILRTLREVRFRLGGAPVTQATWVALVGDFNRWDTAAHRMTREADGSWSIPIILSPGEYRYLFVVDGFPHNDPGDDRRVPCEWGGWYSVRIVR